MYGSSPRPPLPRLCNPFPQRFASASKSRAGSAPLLAETLRADPYSIDDLGRDEQARPLHAPCGEGAAKL